MQPRILISSLFTLSVCYSINTNAATDSLPPCIKTIAKGKLSSYTEYEYNGKKLFSFTTATSYNDSRRSVYYYDSACTLFCTWVRSGIMGAKMLPHTVEKTKIITVKNILFDSLTCKKTNKAVSLPDTIAKIALLKNSQWIEENKSDSGFIYRFQSPEKKPGSSQIIFGLPYFDENGKVFVPKKITGKTCWWHKTGGKFSKTPFRPGYR